MAKSAAIIDFGSQKITVAVVSRGVNNTFHIRGKGECEYDGYEDGEFLVPARVREAVGFAINRAEAESRLEITSVYIGVPAGFTFCRVCDVSLSMGGNRRVRDDDLRELVSQGRAALGTEAMTSAVISCTPVFYLLDEVRRTLSPLGQICSGLNARLSYILCENRFINFVDSILHDCGIEQSEYIPTALAEILYLFEPSVRDNYAVLIDAGYIATDLIIAQGNGIVFQKSYNAGGGYIAAALMEEFGMETYAPAESLKRSIVLTLNAGENDYYEVALKNGETGKFKARPSNAVVREFIIGLAEHMKESMQKCECELPAFLPFYLTGGGISHIRGARELLGKTLEREVILATPIIPQLDRPENSSLLSLSEYALNYEEELGRRQGFLERLKNKFRRR